MSQRVYLVKGSDQVRLVKASTKAQAVGFVARNMFTASVAKQDDLIEYLTSGKTVELAQEELVQEDSAQTDMLASAQ
jgi:hypothetical protein